MFRRLFGLNDNSDKKDEERLNKSRAKLLEEAHDRALEYGFRKISSQDLSSDFSYFFEKLHDCSYKNGISEKIQSIKGSEVSLKEFYQSEIFGFVIDDGRAHDEAEFLLNVLITLCLYDSCFEVLDSNMSILLSKKRQLVYLDEFGDAVLEKWDSYFSSYFNSKLEWLVDNWMSSKHLMILNVMASGDLTEDGKYLKRSMEDKDEALGLFKDLVKNEVGFYLSCMEIGASSDDDSLIFEGSGHEYEYHLLGRLQNETTVNAEVTSGSGDQGADLLVYFEGETYVVQAKHYSSPVGNKAVQEAFSALTYYNANHAIVVANSGFTKSANELALRTGVECLDEAQFVSMFKEGPGCGKRAEVSKKFFELLVETFDENNIEVELVTFTDESVVHLVTLGLEETVFVFGLSEAYSGSVPSTSELEYYQNLVESDDAINVVRIVPDSMESESLQVLIDFQEIYDDGEITFATEKQAIEMIS